MIVDRGDWWDYWRDYMRAGKQFGVWVEWDVMYTLHLRYTIYMGYWYENDRR